MTTYNKLYENWMKHIQEEEQTLMMGKEIYKEAGITFKHSNEGDFKMGGKSEIISDKDYKLPDWVWGSGKTHSFPEGFYGSVKCYGGTVALGHLAKIIPYKDGKLVEQDLTDTNFWGNRVPGRTTSSIYRSSEPWIIMKPGQIWFADGAQRAPAGGNLYKSEEHFVGNGNERKSSHDLTKWILEEANKYPDFWGSDTGSYIRSAVSATLYALDPWSEKGLNNWEPKKSK